MRFLPCVLLLARGGDAPVPTPTPTETADTGSTTSVTTTGTPTTTTETVERVGEVFHWVERAGGGNSQAVGGFFSSTFTDFAAPGPCAALGRLCGATFPTNDTEWVDVVPNTFDPDVAGVGFAGFSINIGGYDLSFQVDSKTGIGAYSGSVIPQTSPLDVALGGDWGDWSDEDVIPPASEFVMTTPTPGSLVAVEDALLVEWPPSKSGEVFIELVSINTHRIWKFVDDGSAVIPAADLGPFEVNEVADITVYRRTSFPDVDADGNTLQVRNWASTDFRISVLDATSCKTVRDNDPSAPSGVYSLQPDPLDSPRDVYCDMTTDGGGWTLVASTRGTPPKDQAEPYHTDLATLTPAASHSGVWDGMRFLAGGVQDVRFTCTQDVDTGLADVDLSFYDVPWYEEFTRGTDADSCFSENEGVGADPAPERTDNLTNVQLAAGDAWDADGYLEGEDGCGDTGDFTVDFDDRGLDSNEQDGTDWGEDDGRHKCGTVVASNDAAWFLFVREA